MLKIKAIFLLECVLCSVMVWLQFRRVLSSCVFVWFGVFFSNCQIMHCCHKLWYLTSCYLCCTKGSSNFTCDITKHNWKMIFFDCLRYCSCHKHHNQSVLLCLFSVYFSVFMDSIMHESQPVSAVYYFTHSVSMGRHKV